MRYALITCSTDQRCPNYQIEFTTSKTMALKHYNKKAVLTHKDAETIRNYHHDITRVLVLDEGYRKPTQKFINDEIFRLRGSIYSPNKNGVIYTHICNHSYDFSEEVANVSV
jgi:hypothetical protein